MKISVHVRAVRFLLLLTVTGGASVCFAADFRINCKSEGGANVTYQVSESSQQVTDLTFFNTYSRDRKGKRVSGGSSGDWMEYTQLKELSSDRIEFSIEIEFSPGTVQVANYIIDRRSGTMKQYRKTIRGKTGETYFTCEKQPYSGF